MQRYHLNKNSTQNINADFDTNAECSAGASSKCVSSKMKMAWYIQMGYTNENVNFTHNVGLVDMELGPNNFPIMSPGGPRTFSVKFHHCIPISP